MHSKVKLLSTASVLSMACLSGTHALADATVETWGLLFSGDYIQVGVNDLGTFGNNGSYGEGVLYDGTGTGTFNTDYDSLAPGSPWEGFTLNDGETILVDNNNSGGGAEISDGTLTNYSGTAYNGSTYDNRAVWTGETADVSFTHDIFFNNADQQIQIATQITAKTDLTDAYYQRSMDPDAVAADGDSSTTRNVYVNDAEQSYIYGEALVSKYVIGLLSTDADTVARVSSSWTADAKDFYEGVDTNDYMASDTESDAVIGLATSLGTLSSGQSISLLYKYIFGTNIEAALEAESGGGKKARTLKPDSYTTAPDLIPSNVPTCDTSKFVSGFQIIGNGEIKYYADYAKRDECFNVDVTILPEDVSAKDVEELLAWLDRPLDVFKLQ